MKTEKHHSMKTGLKAILAAAILTLVACGNNSNPPGLDIHTASLLGDLDAIQKHIQAGSDLDKTDEYGASPLMIAATFGKTEVAKALIEAGADINLQNNEGATALHSAAFLCRTEIVRMLLENGADKSLRNTYGNTALESVAAPFNDVRAIYELFSKDLGPLGLKLDFEQIESTRPEIADMLK